MMAFLISAFIFFGFNLFRSKGVWFFLLRYALIASPLWLYNFSHFGSPTFNFAINHQLWMDRWTDWHPDDLENLPTAWSYLQTHSMGDIIARQWSGMAAMRNIFIKTLWPTRTLRGDQFLLSPLSGLSLILIALLPLIFWRRSGSVDLDGLDPAFAPGVSHPEPGGLSTRDVIGVFQRLRGRVVGADVVELNPSRDAGGITAAVAGKIAKELASRLLSD